MLDSNLYQSLSPQQRHHLAETLGELPETGVVVHSLRQGNCRAYALGGGSHFQAAVIELDYLPAEPFGFGLDVESLWQLLKNLTGWECVLVASDLAPALGRLMAADLGRAVRYYGDSGFILTCPVSRFVNESVRLLTLADVDLLKAAPADLIEMQEAHYRGLLEDGLMAGAIVENELVAFASAESAAGQYAELGVATLDAWRGRGLATASASLVCQQVQAADRTPVWSAGEDNAASLHIARKLGFDEAFSRTYVIP